MPTVAWPRRSLTTFGWTFAPRRSVACVCRSFIQFPTRSMPWSLFWPVVAWAASRRVFVAHGDPERARAWRFLLAWVGVMFIFFSISAGKRELYMVPAMPAGALGAGHRARRRGARATRRQRRRVEQRAARGRAPLLRRKAGRADRIGRLDAVLPGPRRARDRGGSRQARQRAIGRAHADHRARMERGPHALRADAAGRRRERTPSGRTRRAVKLRAVAAERRSLDTSLVSSSARSFGRRAREGTVLTPAPRVGDSFEGIPA